MHCKQWIFDMDASLTETFKGAIVLDEKPPVFMPNGSIAPKVPSKKKDTLESIISAKENW